MFDPRRFAGAMSLGALLCAAAATGAAAQPDPVEPRYFYRGLGYGSDATFHPASEVINGAFGILQISSHWVPLDEIENLESTLWW